MAPCDSGTWRNWHKGADAQQGTRRRAQLRRARRKTRGNRRPPAGPLYGKGMRKGDVLTAQCAGRPIVRRNPNASGRNVDQLQKLPWGRRCSLNIPQRRGPEGFSTSARLGAAGDALCRRQRRMGLLDARGLLRRLDERLPHVRLAGQSRAPAAARLLCADQFYRQLERPRVMERLLPAGNLRDASKDERHQACSGDAAKLAAARSPAGPDRRHAAGRNPLAGGGKVVRGRMTKVKARVELPRAARCSRSKSSPTAYRAPSASCCPSGRLQAARKKERNRFINGTLPCRPTPRT